MIYILYIYIYIYIYIYSVQTVFMANNIFSEMFFVVHYSQTPGGVIVG